MGAHQNLNQNQNLSPPSNTSLPHGPNRCFQVFRDLPQLSKEKVQHLTAFIEKSLADDAARRRNEAMPVYAKKFYDARQRQKEVEEGVTKVAVPQGILQEDDPFAAFLGRLVGRNRHAPAEGASEPGAAAEADMDVDGELEDADADVACGLDVLGNTEADGDAAGTARDAVSPEADPLQGAGSAEGVKKKKRRRRVGVAAATPEVVTEA